MGGNSRCLGCGRSMEGRFFSICPRCGRYMATRTPGQVVLIYSVSAVAGTLLVGLLVVLLWRFA